MSSSSTPRVIIIGGGIIGAASAYHLARRGVAVTLLEREALGVGASSGNAGLIAVGHPPLPKPGVTWQAFKWMFDSTSPLYIPPRFRPDLIRWLWQFNKASKPEFFHRSMQVLAPLGRAAIQSFEEILEAEGIAAETNYHRGGQIEVFKTPGARDACRTEADELRRLGFEIEELDQRQLHAREPGYLDDVLGAVVWTDSAFADPRAFTLALLRCAQRDGAIVHAEQPIESIVVGEGRFHGVRLPDGSVMEADVLILAAGIWTTQLARAIGISVPMQPAKGYHVELSAPPVNVRMAGVLKETFVAINPMGGGLRLAGTLEFSGLDDRVRHERVNALVAGARKYIRGIDECSRLTQWFGYRPCTADGLPVIGRAPQYDNVYLGTGHAMMGFGLGPITGKLLAELVLDGQTSLPLAPGLSPARFAS